MKYISILIALIVFSLYAVTASPFLQAGDSAEMATAAITLGIPHQPSYPLYIIATHLITKLPIPYIGEKIPQQWGITYELQHNNSNNVLIYRTGLASALFQALAAYFLFLTLIEIEKALNKKTKKTTFPIILIATSITFIYSFSETIWLYATKPEVFALNNLFATALLYFAFNWYNKATRARIAPGYFLLLGLAFSHHQTIVLLFPILFLIYVFKKLQLEEVSIGSLLSRWFGYPFERKFNKSFPYFFCFGFALIPFFISLWFLAQRYPLINWGEISSPIGLVRALIRADYGSIGAYLTNVKNSTVAVDQIPFFAQHLLTDFSLLILILAVIGTVVLYRANRRVWGILIAFFLISGPLFIMYANFSLEGDFSKATVVRFYMLPELAIMLLSYATLSIAYQQIAKLDGRIENGLNYKKIGTVFLTLLITGIFLQSSYPNKPIFDNLTYQFAKTSISQTEDNAMILITGDIPNMTMQYMQAVEGEKKNRIIFSPGQFHLKWFQKQLRTRYPNLKIPDPLPGKQFTSPTQVIEANFSKQPIYIVTDFVDIDPEIQKKYVLWPKNLLLKVEAKNVEYKLEPYLAENNALYQSLNLSEIAKLKRKQYQLESPLVFYYSRHFYNLGAIFNTVHRYDDAIEQFKRALSIDPDLADAYKALGTIYYFTEDYAKKDPQLALQYLTRYLQTTDGSSVDQIIAVQDAIKKINEDAKKAEEDYTKQLQQQQQEATPSAESTDSAQIKISTEAGELQE
jgi:hypothetical protein